jgi:rSAM/selenodomain-associated transferase 2
LISAATISVIIPVFNEASNLHQLLWFLLNPKSANLLEVIVVDGGSTDGSQEIAAQYEVKLIKSPTRSRAVQLNLGSKEARGDIFYFLHADSRPLLNFDKDIIQQVSFGNQVGCYRFEFDSSKRLLKVNSWLTRFNGVFSGGGDQSLFITKVLFDKLGGYDIRYSLMEDFDLVRRIRKETHFSIIPKSIKVSARKYDSNSWLKIQVVNGLAMVAFYLKVNPEKIKTLYFSLIKNKI